MKVPYRGGDVLVTFDAEWVVSKTEKEFIEHEKHHGLSDAQLKEAHKLCKEAVKPIESKPATQTT